MSSVSDIENVLHNEDVENIITDLLYTIIDNALNKAINRNIEGRKEKSKKKDNKVSKTSGWKKKQLLPPCNSSCRKQCKLVLNEDTREKIFNLFCSFNFRERYLFFESHIKAKPVKCRTTDTRKKERTLQFTLPLLGNQEAPTVSVCKTMFLRTLGMKTDGFITSHFKKKQHTVDFENIEDKRGSAARTAKRLRKESNDAKIKNYIESYQPQVSHYKLAHAPFRRYLQCDLNITKMWKYYTEICSHDEKVSKEKFRQVFDTLNIGFGTPSQDDCATCTKYKLHKTDTETCDDSCNVCQTYQQHHERYTQARIAYTNDKDNKENNTKFFSVDMQKVLILPKMAVKNAFFISRLVVFNETFAPLKQAEDNLCILWHEGISGRTAADVASTYYFVIKNATEEIKSFVFWADNCSAQNKNWLIFSVMVCIVNLEWGPDTVTFKYFEPGHSFMKADSVHGQIGTEWKSRKNIFDMNDLVDVIMKSGSHNKPVVLNFTNFLKFTDGSKQRRKMASGNSNLPLLEQIRVAEFRKSSRKMYFKTSFSDLRFQESDFLKANFSLEIPDNIGKERGVITEKKNRIIRELTCYMTAKKKMFWDELNVNDQAVDLNTSFQDES